MPSAAVVGAGVSPGAGGDDVGGRPGAPAARARAGRPPGRPPTVSPHTEGLVLAGFADRERSTILIHTYRAMVGRADIWRMRMDTTTNWAIGATAAVLGFAIGNASVPHYAVLIAPLLTLSFLALEARRLTFYHLWQQRVLSLERGLVRPALLGDGATSEAARAELEMVAELEGQLGRTVPTMPLRVAAARRLRRVYLYLFAAQQVAWIVKLSSHPTRATSLGELVERAGMGGVPGALWLAVSLGALFAAGVVAWTLGGTSGHPPELAPR